MNRAPIVALMLCAFVDCCAPDDGREAMHSTHAPTPGTGRSASVAGSGGGPDVTSSSATGGGGSSSSTATNRCVEGTSQIRADEYTMIVTYNDAGTAHGACWYTTADADVVVCEGSYAFGDGTMSISVGLHCPSDWTFKCACRHEPLIGTTVNGTVEMWFYVAVDPPGVYCDGCTVTFQ